MHSYRPKIHFRCGEKSIKQLLIKAIAPVNRPTLQKQSQFDAKSI